MKQDDMALLQIRLPAKLKADFDQYCKERDLTISQALRKYMTQQVRKHGKQKSGGEK